jgi:hypothetical protein
MGEPWSNRKTRGWRASQIRIAVDMAASAEDVFGGPPNRTREPRVLPRGFGLMLLVAEETPAADNLGNLRRDHCVPAFVVARDALENVS